VCEPNNYPSADDREEVDLHLKLLNSRRPNTVADKKIGKTNTFEINILPRAIAYYFTVSILQSYG